jgi:hypothetical protein
MCWKKSKYIVRSIKKFFLYYCYKRTKIVVKRDIVSKLTSNLIELSFEIVDAGDFLGLETTKIRSIIETCSMEGDNENTKGERVRDPKTETGLAIEKDLLKKKERKGKELFGALVLFIRSGRVWRP